MTETYRLDRLYYQLLKPRQGKRESLTALVTKLEEANFIKVMQGRYSETEKLTNSQNRKELFKLVQGVVNEDT
jgi:hypothetical protein